MAWRVALLLLVVLLVPGWASAQTAQTDIGPDAYPDGVSPLTGLPVRNSELLDRRPIIVKISNWPAEVRPQSGLNSADVVWEHVVEGGVTRFSAVFLSVDIDPVGPVRSARLVDIPLTRIYNGLLVHSGSSQGTRDRLRGDAVVALHNFGGGECPPLCRQEREGVAYEHTLYGDTAAMAQAALTYGLDVTPAPVRGMAFAEALPDGGTPVRGIDIAYRNTTIQWDYDEAGGWWTRSQDGEAHYDAYSGAQIRAANLLVLEADHLDQPMVSEGYWGVMNYATQPILTGRGRLYGFRDGRYFSGEWRRQDDDSPLTFHTENGDPLRLKPGNTFINLVPRWFNGYELVFDLPTPLTAEVSIDSAVLRAGPSTATAQVGSAALGTSLDFIGRSNAGDWVQIHTADGGIAWIASDLVALDPAALDQLPSVRSTYEN